VNDSYSYGGPARRTPRLGSIDPVKLGVVALVVALVLAGGYAVFAVLRDGGEVASQAAQDAVGQIDVARDAEAQVTLTRVAVAAQTVMAQSETGSPADVTAEVLGQTEPAFTYTTEASSGPEVVSVAAGADGWSAAVRSASGSCLWLRIDPSGTQTFGSGSPCTGTAAAAAADPSW
jgi:hypothetical protein